MFHYEIKKTLTRGMIFYLIVLLLVFGCVTTIKYNNPRYNSVDEDYLKSLQEKMNVQGSGMDAPDWFNQVSRKIVDIKSNLVVDDAKVFATVISIERGVNREIERYDLVVRFEDGKTNLSQYINDFSYGIFDYYGANSFFGGMNYIWFAYAFIVVLIAYSVYADNKMFMVLNPTKEGIVSIKIKKEIVVIATATVVLTLFFFVNLIINELLVGDWQYMSYPLYMVDGFEECASSLTIGKFMFIQLCFNIMVCILVCEISLFVIRIVKRKALSIIITFFILAFFHAFDIMNMTIYNDTYQTENFRLMSKVTFWNWYDIILKLNAFSLVNANAYFSKPKFDVLGEYIIDIWMEAMLVLIVFAFAFQMLYLKKEKVNQAIKVNNNHKNNIHSILLYEIKKMFSAKYVAGIIIIEFIFAVYLVSSMQGVKNGTETDNIIELYNTYGGELNEEKKTGFNALSDDITTTLGLELYYEDLFVRGEFSPEEYREYRDHFYECRELKKAADIFNNHINDGVEREYLAYEGYFDKIINYKRLPLDLIIIFLYSIAFLIINEKKELKLVLHLSDNGKEKITRNKSLLMLGIGIIIAAVNVLFRLIMLYLYQGRYGMSFRACDISFLNFAMTNLSVSEWIWYYYGALILLSGAVYFIVSRTAMRLYWKMR